MTVEAEPDHYLRGRSLARARAAWIVLALIMCGIVLASLPPYIRFQLTVCETCRITPAYAIILQASGVDPTWLAMIIFIPVIIVFIGWMGMGAAIFFLKSNDRRALLLSALLIIIGASFGGTLEDVYQDWPGWVWLSEIVVALSFPAMGALIYLFPNSTFKPSWLAWLLVVQTLLNIPILLEGFHVPITYNFLVTLSFILSCLVVPLYRYRRVMNFAERQQTKWVVFGIVLAMTGIAITISLVVMAPNPCDTPNLYCDVVQSMGYTLSPVLIPIFIGISILRSRLWDIDVIIRKTLQYGLLTGLLALVYFASVVLLQSLLESATKGQSPLVIVLSTLLIAALFAPLRHRLQLLIDRRFFRKKYDAQQVLARFAQTARDEVDMDNLTSALIEAANETMQPKQVGLWLRLKK